MSKRINLKGQEFGRLLVLEYAYTKHTHAYWRVVCMDCYTEHFVSSSNLRSGNTKGCQACSNTRYLNKQKKEK